MATKFQKIFEPGYIGKVKTKNRMIRMGAMPGFEPYDDGYIQQPYIDFYESLAKGGIGLVTVGVGGPLGAPQGKGYDICDDKYIPRLHELTDTIHKYDCPVFMQMFHIGPWMPNPLTVAASTVQKEDNPFSTLETSRELTVAEIKDIVRDFGQVALRMKKAGFDGVEINAGCSHLFSTFLSRFWNRRQDEYGPSSMENRARIVTEIIREVKKQAGEDFAAVVLYNVAEPGLENGITPAEGQELAKIFAAAGADAINARVEYYMDNQYEQMTHSTHFPDVVCYPEIPESAKANMDTSHNGEGGWAQLAANIKKVVDIPVIAVGRLDPEMGEKLIKKGSVDFISLNRRLMADPELPNKIKEGRIDNIAPCTACMTCFNENELGRHILCRVNAALMNGKDYEPKLAEKKKNVVVIGGGPSGMEAARIAAIRGHKVTLFEKEPMLGGAMNLAAVVKGTAREDLLSLVDYLKNRITKVGVDVKTGKEADRETVQALKPDVIIVAVGGNHNIPDIPGIDNKNVLTSETLHHQLKSYLKLTGAKLMTKLVTRYVPVGKSVVVLGGNIQGCQTAEFLSKRGRKVAIVETSEEIGEGLLENFIKPQLLDWLYRHDVQMIAGARYDEITDKGLVCTAKDGTKQTLEANTILTALPMNTNTALFDSLQGVAPEVYAVGDCREAGLVVDAIADGYRVAREI